LLPMKKEAGESHEKKNSLRTVILFCSIVAIIILVSLIYRGIQLVQHSKFDGKSGIIISLMQKDKKKAAIYSFDPVKESVSVFIIQNRSGVGNLRQILHLPIEGEVKRETVSETTDFPFTITSPSLLLPSSGSEITLLDSFRLWYISKTIAERDKTLKKMNLTDAEQLSDEELSSLFIDSQLENDKQTIAIVNGTSISGLGSRLESQLSHIGGNVIAITTSHIPIQTSRILYYGEPNYTVKKLQRITHFPIALREEGGISDILIEIGEDEQRTVAF
jgi:hypothetical protein